MTIDGQVIISVLLSALTVLLALSSLWAFASITALAALFCVYNVVMMIFQKSPDEQQGPF